MAKEPRQMSERELALNKAKFFMDQTDSCPGIDPDDDLRLLSRQLLRGQETIEKLKSDLKVMDDPMGDLIQANRDQILKMHEEAIRRIKKHLDIANEPSFRAPDGNIQIALDIIEALNTFHPMHCESWQGWPKESDPMPVSSENPFNTT